MCDFFSCISNGRGAILYFDSVLRKRILSGDLKDRSGNPYTKPDSHTSICSYFDVDEDRVNKWEYNPLTRELTLDQLNTRDDERSVYSQCVKLDFREIVPELIIKPVVNPLTDVRRHRVTRADIDNLRKWASVRDSVCWACGCDYVEDSVCWACVCDVIESSVWSPIWACVWSSVKNSIVSTQVENSVRAFVQNSAWDSVEDSVNVYISSFFTESIWPGGHNPYQCSNNLWERGFVPVLIGSKWALCQGKNAKIVYTLDK